MAGSVLRYVPQLGAAWSSLALLWLAATQAATHALQALGLVYRAGGASSVYASTRLARCLRDIHTASQHMTVMPTSYEVWLAKCSLVPTCPERSGDATISTRRPIIDMCINNRHRDHKKGGNSEPVMNERMSSGRLRTFLVRRQSVASNSSRFFGLPFARVPLKWAHTSSSGLSSGA